MRLNGALTSRTYSACRCGRRIGGRAGQGAALLARSTTSARRLPALGLSVLAGIALLLATACGNNDTDADDGEAPDGTVTLEGSSTVQPFTIELIDAFNTEYPGIRVNPPSGLGSGAGISSLINRQTDIAQSSRGIKEDELDQAADAGLDVFETRIFNDALGIVVHPSNPVDELTDEQVARIFAGEIRDWSDVGGNAGRITLYTRNEESGTFAYMEEDVIQKILGSDAEYDPRINKQASAPAALTAVANDESGIVYAGLGNIAELPQDRLKVLRIAADGATEAVYPSSTTVNDGSYPIARGLFYYTDGDPATHPNPAVRTFSEFALSPTGQAIGEDLGFLPVNPVRDED
jgi:phosphate transport system substrate-binding protein